MQNQSQKWMKTTEIYQMLKEQKYNTLSTLPTLPQSGQFFLIKPEKERGWKKDGYQYVPRHNGVGTKEDVEKLKINGVPMIVCLYSQTIKRDGQQLNRRIYKLLEQSSNIYLVHYLSSIQDQNDSLNQPQFIQENLPTQNDFQYDSWFNCDLFDQQSDQSLQQKIQFLEQRIQFLEQERNTGQSTATHKDSQDDINTSFKEQVQVRIIDYSPEWDYTEGGTKMMLCFQPIRQLSQCQLLFGNITVEANCVQPGVLKCSVPPNEPGKVQIKIISNNSIIDETNEINYFTYEKKQRQKKEKSKKQKIIQKDTLDNTEFKVRVIEKLTSFQNYFNNQFAQCEIEQETLESSDQITDESIVSLIQKVVIMCNDKFLTEKLPLFFNEQDQYGFSLIHYLTLLGFSQSIKIIIKNGANINQQGSDGLTALQIAIISQYENIVNLLIQLGAIDEQFQDLNGDENQQIDKLFTLDPVYKNKKILDHLIRGYTLCDSIHNSSQHTEQQSWNGQDDQESLSFFEVNDLFENKNSPAIKEEKQAKHKYLRNYTKHEIKPQQQEFSSNFPYDNYANHIQTIQKNVKAWLLRRQYLDIKYATQVLQNYIRNKLHKKQVNFDCKSKIKSTVRNWLNLKD